MKVSAWVSVELASLKEEEEEEEEGEKSIFDRVWFGMKTAVLEGDTKYFGSISHIKNDSEA